LIHRRIRFGTAALPGILVPEGADCVELQICPIKELLRLVKTEEMTGCAAILSSAYPMDPQRLGSVSFIFRQYEDLDYECAGRSFSREDARAFEIFLRNLDPEVHTLYCCCDAGESRSPAVAAAVMRYWGMDDLPVWQNPHYHPNMLVFDLLTRELNVPVSDEDKDARLYENMQAFRTAIRGRKIPGAQRTR